MPTKEQWEAEALHQYGLIAVDSKGDAMQLEKVSHTETHWGGPGTGKNTQAKLAPFLVKVDSKLMDGKDTNLEILNAS